MVVEVKKILEEKKVADENIKTHDRKIYRIDANEPLPPSPPRNKEEEMFEILYQKPESAYK
jgi:hypothetical protein